MARNKTVRFPNLVLTISIEAPGKSGSWEYGHVRGWMNTADNSYFSTFEPGGEFKGVIFNAQTDRSYLIQDDLRDPVYAYRAEWKGDNQGLDELKRGVKAIGHIEKKLEEFRVEFGPPASFGAWVQRVCNAIGIDKVRLPNKSYNVSPLDAAGTIDGHLREWVRLERERQGKDAA